MLRPRPAQPAGSSGFILAYVMFSLAVLSIVVTGLSYLAYSGVIERQIASDVDRIVAGARLVRMQVLLCAATYPKGASVTLSGGTGSVSTSYPVLSGQGGALRTGSGDAAGLMCPGAPAAAQGLWSSNLGASGAFYPQPPAGFGNWNYAIGDDGLTVDLTINQTVGGASAAALRRAALQLASAASYSESSGTLSMPLARP